MASRKEIAITTAGSVNNVPIQNPVPAFTNEITTKTPKIIYKVLLSIPFPK